jgi:hypothetical protein
VQEEPANQGAWTFLALALPELIPALAGITRISRRAMAAPSAGSARVHEVEQAAVIAAAFAPANVTHRVVNHRVVNHRPAPTKGPEMTPPRCEPLPESGRVPAADGLVQAELSDPILRVHDAMWSPGLGRIECEKR